MSSWSRRSAASRSAAGLLVATPAWEAADEPDHVKDVETLASGDWYRMEPGALREAHQAPLYYAVLAAWQKTWHVPVRTPRPAGAEFSPLSAAITGTPGRRTPLIIASSCGCVFPASCS